METVEEHGNSVGADFEKGVREAAFCFRPASRTVDHGCGQIADYRMEDAAKSAQVNEWKLRLLAVLESGRTALKNQWVLPPNGRFLRHRFSPKPTSVATPNSLPKRNHVAKEAVSAAWQTRTRQRSERIRKPNDTPRTKPRPCVKTMLYAATRWGRSNSPRKAIGIVSRHAVAVRPKHHQLKARDRQRSHVQGRFG